MGKILPNNIPSWMRDSVNISYLENNVVDLDVDIPKLFDDLHRQAMVCLESIDENVLKKGREYLLSMLEIIPNNATTLYNLACAESLLNNVPEALNYMLESIKNGYSNVEHMIEDADLDNIKNTELFQNIVTALESGDLSILFGDDVPFESFDENIKKAFESEKVESVPEPEPEPEQEPEPEYFEESVDPLLEEKKIKYQSQLKMLEDMGFVDDEIAIMLLDEYKDINDVINGLVQLYASTNRPIPHVEPEPEPEPEPVVDPRFEQWSSAIEVISKMGFEISEKILDILDKAKGDVGQAIVDILEDQ
jgi:hypothetical protein